MHLFHHWYYSHNNTTCSHSPPSCLFGNSRRSTRCCAVTSLCVVSCMHTTQGCWLRWISSNCFINLQHMPSAWLKRYQVCTSGYKWVSSGYQVVTSKGCINLIWAFWSSWGLPSPMMVCTKWDFLRFNLPVWHWRFLQASLSCHAWIAQSLL